MVLVGVCVLMCAIACDDETKECIPGQQLPCTCSDGTPRFRLCHSDRTWDECLCYGTGGDVSVGGDAAKDAGPMDTYTPKPDELCNGKDDDGDGAIDEWQAGSNESCIVKVPSGAFLMGCKAGTAGCQADEQPEHEVSLSAFSMDKTEVTQAHWNACIIAGKCPTPKYYFKPFNRPDHPVVMVNWFAASTFCAWRGGRLPTEAEWERAASAGKGRPWPWGSNPPTCERCNTKGCGEKAKAVGMTGPAGASAEGAYDLAGNVREWVIDQYDAAGYPPGQATNPVQQQLKASAKRVVRGGGSVWPAEQARPTARMAIDGDDTYDDIGFRCVYSDAKLNDPDGNKPPTKPEICNGVDDDNDGAVDEWTPTTNEACVVKVPAGAFQMGCKAGDKDCGKDEQPAHPVTLSAYALDRTEVSERHWAACVKAGKCTTPAGSYAPEKKGDYPVAKVTWVMATAFCKWRGGRLPTEAEWERVATHGIGYLWPWGDKPPTCKQANFKGCGSGGRTKVGSFGAAGASVSGVFDLAGNVAEWVLDHYDSGAYEDDKDGVLNPTHPNPKSGATRVARGGSADSTAASIRASNRMAIKSEAAYSDLGFRCAYPDK